MWYFFQFFTIFHSRPWRYSLRWSDTWPGANVGIPTPHDGVIPPELGVKTSGGIVTVIAPCWTNRTLAFYGGIWDTDTVASYTTIPNWPTGIPYFKLGVSSLLKNLHISCKLLEAVKQIQVKTPTLEMPISGTPGTHALKQTWTHSTDIYFLLSPGKLLHYLGWKNKKTLNNTKTTTNLNWCRMSFINWIPWGHTGWIRCGVKGRLELNMTCWAICNVVYMIWYDMTMIWYYIYIHHKQYRWSMYKLCIVKITEFVKIHLSNKSQNKESWKLTGLVDEPLNHSTKLGEKMKLWKLHKWIYPKTNNWAKETHLTIIISGSVQLLQGGVSVTGGFMKPVGTDQKITQPAQVSTWTLVAKRQRHHRSWWCFGHRFFKCQFFPVVHSLKLT